MRRAVVGAATCGPAVALSGAVGRSIYTTAQDAKLVEAAAERDYKSNMWVGLEDEKWWYATRSSLKPDAPQRALTCVLHKRLELVNGSQLATPVDRPEPEVHSSMASSKPYRGQTVRELEQRALLHDYQSKWWLTPNQVRQHKLRLKPRTRPHVLLIKVPTAVVNVEEFVDSQVFDGIAFGGDSGRPMFGRVGDQLTAASKDRGYTLPIFFTADAINDLQLVAKESANPIITSSEDTSTYFNLEEFASRDALQRFIPEGYTPDPANPRYLTTGTPMTQEHAVSAMKSSGFNESLWMSLKDLGFKEKADPNTFRLLPGATGIAVPQYTAPFYNIDDLQDTDAALKAVGKLTR